MSDLKNRIIESRNRLIAGYDRIIDVLGRLKFTNSTTPTTPTVPLPTSATITANPNPPSASGQTTYTVRTNNSWSGTLYISYYQDAPAGTGNGGTVPVSFNKSVAINNGTGSVSFALPFPESISSYNTLHVRVFTTDGQTATMSGGGIGSASFTLQAIAPNPSLPTYATITASPNPPNVTGNSNYTVTTGNSWTGTLYLSYYQDAPAGTGNGGTVPVSFNKTVSIVNGSGTVAFPIPFPESVSSYNTLHVRVYTTGGQSAIMGGGIGSAVFTLQNVTTRTLRISNVAPDPLPLSGNVSFNIISTGLANGTQVNWAINYLFRDSFIDNTAIYHSNVVTGTATINNGSAYVSTSYPARSTGGKTQGYLNVKATTSNGAGGVIYSDDVNAGATFTMR